jgi:hypothetical protein
MICATISRVPWRVLWTDWHERFAYAQSDGLGVANHHPVGLIRPELLTRPGQGACNRP